MPDDESDKPLSPLQDALRARQVTAVKHFLDYAIRFPRQDTPSYRRHVREVLQAIDQTVASGIEYAVSWGLLASHTIDPRERIGYLARGLDALESGRDPMFEVCDEYSHAEALTEKAAFLFHIGLIHARHDNPVTAEDFLRRALPLAEEAERIREILNSEPLPESERDEEDEWLDPSELRRPSLAEPIREALERLPDVEPEPAEGSYLD